MSVRDIAFGLISSGGIAGGRITLSPAHTNQLRHFINRTGEAITVTRFASGGCELSAEDLVRTVLTEDEIEELLETPAVDEPIESVMAPAETIESFGPDDGPIESISPKGNRGRRKAKAKQEETADVE